MNALVTVETLSPATVFAPGGVESIISKLEADVRGFVTDISTESGRKAVASLAYKVARSKTALDEMGKELVSDLKSQTGKIDAERRIIRERLDALRDEVRKPLDDFEAAERDRIASHEQAIAALVSLQMFDAHEPSSEIIQGRIDELNAMPVRDWQEFAKRAELTMAEVGAGLAQAKQIATKREAEAAELARLRQEQAERERAERDAKIAAEAAEHARIEAEARAKREAEEVAARADAERKRAEQEKADALARAERAEADKKAAAAKAERAAKEAAEAAERNRLASIEAERKRVADAAAKEAAEKARREADKAHRAKFNNEALAILQTLGMDKALGVTVLSAIARGEVPHVSINY